MEDRNPELLAALAARGIRKAQVLPTGGNCWAVSWPVSDGLLLLATSDCDVATGPSDMPFWSFTIASEQDGSGVTVELGLDEAATVDQLAEELAYCVPRAVRRARVAVAQQGLHHLTLADLDAEADDEQRLPACPSCRQRRWKVDEQVTVRAAVVLGEDDETVVFVNRAGGDPARLPERPLSEIIYCHACGYELTRNGAEADAAAEIYAAARRLVASSDATWKILTDYREF
jgi:hypothetical protein